MDYEKKYKEAIKRAKSKVKNDKDHVLYEDDIIDIFPELVESEGEKIRKALVEMVHDTTGDSLWIGYNVHKEDALAWLEKQGNYHKGFHDGYQHGVHEEKPLKWTKHDELVRKEAISCLKHWRSLIPDTWNEDYKNILMWLENELSIHAEKQGVQKSIWHNEDEEPQRDSLILLIMQSGTPIVAKIIEPNHTFNHGERWAYIDDLLEKQDKQKPIEIISAEESLGIDSDTYNKIVDECIFGEQKSVDKVESKK